MTLLLFSKSIALTLHIPLALVQLSSGGWSLEDNVSKVERFVTFSRAFRFGSGSFLTHVFLLTFPRKRANHSNNSCSQQRRRHSCSLASCLTGDSQFSNIHSFALFLEFFLSQWLSHFSWRYCFSSVSFALSDIRITYTASVRLQTVFLDKNVKFCFLIKLLNI